jgi:hypothetical protein
VDVGMPLEPAVLFRLVTIQIVQHNVDFGLGVFTDDLVHEVQELSPAAARIVAGPYLPSCDLKRSEQCRRAARDDGFKPMNRTTAPMFPNSERWSTRFSEPCRVGTSKLLSQYSIPTYECASTRRLHAQEHRERSAARNWAQGAVTFSQMARFAQAAIG